MGLIRGGLSLVTFGAVASRSKKQRTAAMTLAAIQGKSDQEIQIAGGRSFDAVNRANALGTMTHDPRRAQLTREARLAQETVRRQMRPYLKKGVIEPGDLDFLPGERGDQIIEVRLRKVMAYDGIPPEIIDENIARAMQERKRLRREGKVL